MPHYLSVVSGIIYSLNPSFSILSFNAFVNEGIGFAQIGYREITEDGNFLYNTRTIDIVNGTRVENVTKMIKKRLASLVDSSIVADKMINLVRDYLEGKFSMN